MLLSKLRISPLKIGVIDFTYRSADTGGGGGGGGGGLGGSEHPSLNLSHETRELHYLLNDLTSKCLITEIVAGEGSYYKDQCK